MYVHKITNTTTARFHRDRCVKDTPNGLNAKNCKIVLATLIIPRSDEKSSSVDLNTNQATCCANSRLSPIVFVSYHFNFMAVRPPRTYHAINSHPGVDNNSTRFLALPICIESCNEIVNIMRRWPSEFLRFLRSFFFLSKVGQAGWKMSNG